MKTAKLLMIHAMIANGELNSGSIYYDSAPNENIIGFYVSTTGDYKQLLVESVMVQFKEYNRKFYDIFDRFGNLYLTLNIT